MFPDLYLSFVEQLDRYQVRFDWFAVEYNRLAILLKRHTATRVTA